MSQLLSIGTLSRDNIRLSQQIQFQEAAIFYGNPVYKIIFTEVKCVCMNESVEWPGTFQIPLMKDIYRHACAT
jgi:hypothetical protein